MKVKNDKGLYIALNSIFLIVFNLIYFLLFSGEATAASWIAYFSIHVAYLWLMVTPIIAKTDSRQAVLEFPVYSVTSLMFVVVIIVGGIFIINNPESWKVALITMVLIQALFGYLLLANLLTNKHTARSLKTHQEELQYIKIASARLDAIRQSISDKPTEKAVESAYDLIHSSPVQSNITVRDYELEVLGLIDQLADTVRRGKMEQSLPLVDSITTIAEERNRMIRLLSHA